MRRQSGIAGIIAAGGSGGTSMAAPAMRSLPIGVPKIMISTVASGDVQRYVGASDILMMYSVTDVQGLNSISRQILANGAQAMLGMVKARAAAMRASARAPPGAAGAARNRADHVRRHHAVRAADRGPAEGRLRVPRFPRHRRRRAVDGEAHRFRPARRRDRHHDDRSLRPADGRGDAGHRGPLRLGDPRAHALCRLLRGARHGQFRPGRHRARPLPGPHPLPAQSAGHLDAHHGRGERPHRPLDRRAPQPDGCAGALLPAGGRRLRARCAGRRVPRSGGGCRAVYGARTHGAADRDAPARPACRSTSTIRSFPPRSCRRSAPCMAAAASGAGSRGSSCRASNAASCSKDFAP